MTYIPNPEMRKRFNQAIREGLAGSQVILSSSIQKMLSKPGTGRLYRVNKGRGKRARNLRESGFHRASAPGQPPAVNTNRLRGSWSIAIKSGKDLLPGYNTRIIRGKGMLGYEMGSSVVYAPMLEYGTRRMKARPYIKPTLPLVAKKLPNIFATAMRRNLGG
jgi:hypothetical protein